MWNAWILEYQLVFERKLAEADKACLYLTALIGNPDTITCWSSGTSFERFAIHNAFGRLQTHRISGLGIQGTDDRCKYT